MLNYSYICTCIVDLRLADPAVHHKEIAKKMAVTSQYLFY
jgi:predicted transcriptional regulator